jgi:hypothetical protein
MRHDTLIGLMFHCADGSFVAAALLFWKVLVPESAVTKVVDLIKRVNRSRNRRQCSAILNFPDMQIHPIFRPCRDESKLVRFPPRNLDKLKRPNQNSKKNSHLRLCKAPAYTRAHTYHKLSYSGVSAILKA